MSKNQSVDERIVQMQFNNADFESKVSQTLESLAKLREQTKMEDAGKGMENLAKGVKQVDVQSLINGIEQLNQKFSVFGIAGQQIIRNMTDAAMNLGKQLTNAMLSGPTGGMQTYESFTSATKQLVNSAKDINGLPVTLQAVNDALDDLNNYSDKTIYSFNDMTANIGKFTNAGVSLDKSVIAIKGISNVAASAGASAQNAAAAMYNFGQALGTGVVKLVDWKSINNANMGTIEFKNSLIQTAKELGTLKEMGDKYIATTYSGKKATEEAFNANSKFEDSLQQQWMTSEVLIKTLEKYADETSDVGAKAYKAATEVNTFTQMMSVFAESQKTSWSKVWRFIFGDYEESKNMWTGILNELNGLTSTFFDNLTGEENGIIRAWHDRGGRDDLIEGFKNIWIAAKGFIQPVNEMINNMLDWRATETLLSFSANFRAFAEKIAEPFKKATETAEELENAVEEVADDTERFKELVQEIIDGKWGNGEERIRRLEEAGYAFENLQNGVNETLDCTKRYETTVTDAEAATGKLVKSTEDQAKAQKNYREEIKKSNNEMFVHKGVVENLAYIMLGVGSAVKVVSKTTELAVKSFKNLTGGVGPVKAALGLILDILGNLARHLYNFNQPIILILDEAETLGEALDQLKQHFMFLFGILPSGENVIEGTNDKFKEAKKLFSNIVGIIDIVRNKVVSFFGSFKKLGDAEFLVDLRIVLEQIGKYIGGVLMITLNAIAGVINNLIDGAKTLKSTLEQNVWVTKLKGAFDNAKTSITGFWDSLKGGPNAENNSNLTLFLDGFAKGLSKVAGVISGVGSKAFNWFVARLGDLNKASKQFYDYLKSVGAVDRIKSMWDTLKNVLYDIPTIIDNFTKSIKNGKLPSLSDLSGNLSLFVQSLGETATGIRNYIGGVFTKMIEGLIGGVTNIASLQLPDKVKEFANKLGAAFGLVSDTTSGAAKTVKDLVTNVIEKLKNIDIKNLAITGLIGSIALFVARWSKVGKSSSNALKALTTFLKNGGKAATDAKEKFNGFLKIAAALLLVAAALWVIGQIPADRFKASVITLGIAFLAMFGVIELLSHQKIDNDKLKGVGIAFAGIGAGVLLIAAAVKAFGTIMNDDNFAKGCVAVIVTIGLMVAAIKTAGPVSDGLGAAFAGLALGVLILAAAVKAFASMKWQTLVKGGIAVTAFIFIMAGAMKLAGNVKAEGFIGLAASILILMLAVKSLGGIKTGKLVKGEIAVIALIAAMALASKAAKDVDGDAFKAMGGAIKYLAAAVWILAKIPTAKLIIVTAALVLIFKTMTDAVKELKEMEPKDSAKLALALVAFLAPIGVALYLLSKIEDTDKVLKVAVSIAGILWALGQAAPGIAELSKIDFAAGVKAIGIADVFFASVAALLAGLGWLTDNTGFGDAMVTGAETIGRALHAFIESLIFGDSNPGEVIVAIGNALDGFGEKMSSFIDMLTGMDPSVAESAKNLALAILAICGAEVLEAVAGFIAGKTDFEGFGDAISGVTGAILKINDALKGEGNEFDARSVNKVIKCVKALVEIAQELPRQGGWLQRIVGSQDLGNFAEQMASFINNGFRTFFSAVNLLGDKIDAVFVTRVMMIKTATMSLVKLAQELPASTGSFSFVNLFGGKKDLGNFASQMAAFMTGGFSEFITEVNKLPAFEPSKIDNEVAPATESMIKLAKKLSSNTSILSYFTGKSDLSIFGSTLASFSKGVREFMDNVVGFRPVDIDAFTACMERIAELNANPNLDNDNLAILTNALLNLGAGLKGFVEDTSTFTDEYISGIIRSLTNLHNLLLIMGATDYSGINGFADAIATVTVQIIAMANLLVDTLVDEITGRFSDVKKLGEDLAADFCDGFGSTPWAKFAGQDVVLKILEGIEFKWEDVKTTAYDTAAQFCNEFSMPAQPTIAGIGIMIRIIDAIKYKFTDVYNTGGSAALKFCTGLTEKNAGLIKGAGHSVVAKAIEGIEEKEDKFEDKGEDAAEGYADGIRSGTNKYVKSAAEDMAQAALDKVQQTQQSASPSKKFRMLGGDGGEGYGLGFTDMIGFVKRSVTRTGNAGILAMRNSIEKMNSMIDDSIDYEPTITPVLDLTQLTNGMRSTRGLLSDLNNTKTDIQAALDIADAHNKALVQTKSATNRDYTMLLGELLKSTKDINKTAGKNRTAVIDGDHLFGYMNQRFGMA